MAGRSHLSAAAHANTENTGAGYSHTQQDIIGAGAYNTPHMEGKEDTWPPVILTGPVWTDTHTSG